jgi:hypothetical protein
VTEWDLLLFLATPARTNRGVEWTEHESVDWERFVSLARVHRLGPVLLANAEHLDNVPKWVRDELRARTRVETGSLLHLTSELHTVLNVLEAADIEALPYKGPILSTVAHGDIGAREFDDIDLVVDPGSYQESCELLEAGGYSVYKRLGPLGETVLTNDVGGLIEVHSHVFPRYLPADLAFDTLWRRRTTVEVGDREVPALAPADRVVVLCVHGTRHCWSRLSWVHDIATLVATDQVPWEEVRERAAEHGCLRHVHLGYWLAREVFEVSLPPDVAQTVDADPTVATLGREAIERLRATDPSPPTDSEQHRYQWRALDSWPDRLVYATRVATMPSEGDVESVSLPDALAPLYRVVRPVRLVARGGRQGVQRLRSRV